MSTYKALFPILPIFIMGMCCTEKIPSSVQDDRADDNYSRVADYAHDEAIDRLEAKYDYVRSYPGGGGIFLIRILPREVGPDVRPDDGVITIDADPDLNALVTTYSDNQKNNVAEITINPSADIPFRLYPMRVGIINPDGIYSIPLEVDVINLQVYSDSMAVVKRDEFYKWLCTKYPELSEVNEMEWHSYKTYPGILVVDHWTFLNERYELRVCWHVMIPPYDWSMISIRQRGQWEPFLAARRESDGFIHEIPIADYPTLYGY